jgi:hypothetical protein
VDQEVAPLGEFDDLIRGGRVPCIRNHSPGDLEPVRVIGRCVNGPAELDADFGWVDVVDIELDYLTQGGLELQDVSEGRSRLF